MKILDFVCFLRRMIMLASRDGYCNLDYASELDICRLTKVVTWINFN